MVLDSLKIAGNYRPQTKFAKVMFLQVSVCPQGGGVRDRGKGACVAGAACMARMPPPADTTRYGDTVNERAVRILLECILVTGRNEVLAKVMFLHLSVILLTGGGKYLTRPPPDQTPPWTRPPLDQTHPPGTRTPPDQTPPGPDTPPPRDQAGTPQTREVPPDQTPPPGTRPDPHPGTADSGIRSTFGRYASSFNAFLLFIIFISSRYNVNLSTNTGNN